MKDRLPFVFWVQSSLAAAAALLAVLTFALPDWFEFVFSLDPDNRSGAFEWQIVLCLAFAAALFAALAARQWRKLSIPSTSETGHPHDLQQGR